MSKNISPDSVRSGRTCPANLGVRSCPVRKLICPVRLSPTFERRSQDIIMFTEYRVPCGATVLTQALYYH